MEEEEDEETTAAHDGFVIMGGALGSCIIEVTSPATKGAVSGWTGSLPLPPLLLPGSAGFRQTLRGGLRTRVRLISNAAALVPFLSGVKVWVEEEASEGWVTPPRPG